MLFRIRAFAVGKDAHMDTTNSKAKRGQLFVFEDDFAFPIGMEGRGAKFLDLFEIKF
jgi:hypothetical protein